jgi:hypothetical protein
MSAEIVELVDPLIDALVNLILVKSFFSSSFFSFFFFFFFKKQATHFLANPWSFLSRLE